jgi:hypothetical protein
MADGPREHVGSRRRVAKFDAMSSAIGAPGPR